MSDSAATVVRCECGRTEIVSVPGVTFTNVRCPWCPTGPKHDKTCHLRLVQTEGDDRGA